MATVGRLGEQEWGEQEQRLGLQGEVQRSNAALALALATHFLEVVRSNTSPKLLLPTPGAGGQPLPCLLPLAIPPNTARGLALTRWPGRSQVISRAWPSAAGAGARGLQWCLDGAHTEDSVLACTQWFQTLASPPSAFRVLVFNTTGDRDVASLLQPLASLDLDLAVFCTNLSSSRGRRDQENFTTTSELQLRRCEQHLKVWHQIQEGRSRSVPAIAIPCINEALLWVSGGREPALLGYQEAYQGLQEAPQEMQEAPLVQVLVTGSLHLVGGVLALIQPGGQHSNGS